MASLRGVRGAFVTIVSVGVMLTPAACIIVDNNTGGSAGEAGTGATAGAAGTGASAGAAGTGASAGNAGNAGAAGGDLCTTLDFAPIPASPIAWSGFPACDPQSGFCIENPAPMQTLGRASMSPTGTAFTTSDNTVASWRGGTGTVYRVATDRLGFDDVFAISDTDVWAVGEGNVLAHFDGSAWTPSKLQEASWLSAVWASGPNDVWAAGNFGIIGHYGGAWTVFNRPGEPSFQDIAGSGPNDVWAVGASGALDKGYVEHWDGSKWTSISVNADGWLEAVWVTGPDDVWIVGREGIVLRGNEQGFSPVAIAEVTDDKQFFSDVWGSSPSDVWITGSYDLLHFDGTSWQRSDPIGDHLAGRSATDVIALGDDAMRWDGTQWTKEFSVKGPELNAAWAASDSDVWSVGGEGAVLRVKDGALLRGTLGDDTLTAVWGASTTDIWIGSQSGVLYHGDGTTFCEVELPNGEHGAQAISGSGPSDVWLVSGFGTVLRYDGSKWEYVGDLDAEWVIAFSPSDAWAAGDSVHHWNGADWETVVTGGFGDHFGPLWGPSPDDIWISTSPYMMHWDGSSVTTTDVNGSSFGALFGSAKDDVWSIGFYTQHFDGSKWQEIPSGRLPVNAGAVTAKDVWAVGYNSLVLHKKK
jgi:hypothetical protein